MIDNVTNVWITGHQPIMDFHTGLLAKVWEVKEKNGVIFFHDLDTLDEKGSTAISIPVPVRGKGKKDKMNKVSLFDGSLSRYKMFISGPIKVIDFRDSLRDALMTLADGKINRSHFEEVDWRINRLYESFLPGKEFSNVAELNISLLKFLLPRLGIICPVIQNISELLKTSWKEELAEMLEELPKITRSDIPPPFWRWDKTENQRYSIMNWEEARALLEDDSLVPKAIALTWLVRSILQLSMIQGTGQGKYSEELEQDAKKIGKTLAPVMTITSQQELPPIWESLAPKGFRPSALLLWLTGGQFDPFQIEQP